MVGEEKGWTTELEETCNCCKWREGLGLLGDGGEVCAVVGWCGNRSRTMVCASLHRKDQTELPFMVSTGPLMKVSRQEEEVEQDIKKGKEVKESRRKEVEKKINSQVKTHQDCNK
ncbi:hypothetical protein V6N13_011301 [Hibiscus sabdariffa]|uniref:Uncharacterized protein n=1 Tax=Hibiscus sabdariffa TaxID=183260 RepID=A0ABR2SC89_9ROSI